MKFAKILLALTLCLCMLAPCVYASTTAVYNSATDTVTVSGVVDKLSENLVGNDIANPISDLVAGKWGVANSTVPGVSLTAKLTKEGDVITLASRPKYYTRLVQSIDENVKKYGAGKYKISGSVKLELESNPKTARIESYVSVAANKPDGDQKNIYCRLIDKTEKDTLDMTKWQDFSFEVNITKEDLIGGNKMKIQFDSYDTTDISFKNLKFEYVYDIPEKLGVAVKDASKNLIYADEIVPNADGTYKTAFQLKEENLATNCTASLYNPSSGKINNVNITNGTNLGTVNMVKESGKVTVTFDVFDYINVRNKNNFVIYAANYKDNMLAGVKVVPFTVNKTSLITQEIAVNSDADSTSLFLFDEIDGTYYPIAKASNVTHQ